MTKHRPWRWIAYGFGGLCIVLALAVFIFIKFYFEDYANNTLVPKLSDAVAVASHGTYAVKVGRIYFSGTSIFGKAINFYRTRYDTSEHGVVVKRLTIDTVLFHGIGWWDLLWGKGLHMTSLEINSPKLYTTDADTYVSSGTTTKDTSQGTAARLPDIVPHIAIDSIVLTNIQLFLPRDSLQTSQATFRSISLRVQSFLLDSNSLKKKKPLFFSERVDFNLPHASYSMADSMFSFDVVNLHGNLQDSLLAIDSFAYKPNYSDDAFAAMHKYNQGRLEFHCTGVALHGLDFPRLLTASGIEFRKCEATTWKIDFYTDNRKQFDPHPPKAPMPNDLVTSSKLPISFDSLILNEGYFTVRSRQKGSVQEGMLYFTHARVAASPFSTDSTNVNFKKQTQLAFHTYFVGQGLLTGVATYPLQQKPFDLDIKATVSGFDAKKLNPWLIPVERMQISDGVVQNGDISMKIRAGTATTSVTPRYKNLYIKMLAKDPRSSSGILEGIKNLVANTFVLRSNNVDKPGSTAMTGATSRKRLSTEEFFQFIWLALRQSLGKVVGGFK
jgi:hypothetical protein